MNRMHQRFLQEIKQQVAHLIETDADPEELRQVADSLPTRFQNEIKRLTSEILDSITDSASAELAEDRRNRGRFRERNEVRWGRGFDLLDLHIIVSTDSGALFLKHRLQGKGSTTPILDDTLARLHAKGCQCSREISCLLRNGFADGAHARWRSLHEISVSAQFLSKEGEVAAKLFRDHSVIDSYRTAKLQRQYSDKLNLEDIPDECFADLAQRYRSLIDTHGKDFSSPYGWAGSFANNPRPNFTVLEQAVGLSHWRPYYKLASHNVHAGPKAIGRLLSNSTAPIDGILAGASDSGMIDPAHSTAVSLSQLTGCLLLSKPTLDSCVMTYVLLGIADRVGSQMAECEGSQTQ